MLTGAGLGQEAGPRALGPLELAEAPRTPLGGYRLSLSRNFKEQASCPPWGMRLGLLLAGLRWSRALLEPRSLQSSADQVGKWEEGLAPLST